jgi:phosphoserine aminotransferase
MHSNALNFSAGPGALPATVLSQTRDAMLELPETGVSVLGMSHRSEWFLSILDEAERNLRALLGLSDRYSVTFLQGGSSLLFATVPMNFATSALEFACLGRSGPRRRQLRRLGRQGQRVS